MTVLGKNAASKLSKLDLEKTNEFQKSFASKR